jgi:hypothetical protein
MIYEIVCPYILNFLMSNGPSEGVYFASWGCHYGSSGDTLDLANVDCKCVLLCFVQPDCAYAPGSQSFSGTGLQFSSDFSVVKSAVDKLRSKGTLVYLSVGGGSYQNWSARNVANCIALAKDLHCDGIDIDWEKTYADRQEAINVITEFSAQTWQNKLKLSAAVWSTGAYDNNGDTYAGLWKDVLAKTGQMLDMIQVMAYDAGPSYNPIEAFYAYRKAFAGHILLGMEVGKPGWDPDMNNPLILSETQVSKIADFIKTQLNAGWFVWEYFKQGQPNFQRVREICRSKLTQQPTPQTSESPRAPSASPTSNLKCPYCSNTLQVSFSKTT